MARKPEGYLSTIVPVTHRKYPHDTVHVRVNVQHTLVASENGPLLHKVSIKRHEYVEVERPAMLRAGDTRQRGTCTGSRCHVSRVRILVDNNHLGLSLDSLPVRTSGFLLGCSISAPELKLPWT